jgi:O-antigen/teichoic acid export membrane protein
METSDDLNPSLSQRYQKFLFTSIIRTIITRIFSIGYILVLVRLVPRELQDDMIILAMGHGITITIALFGSSYGLTLFAIRRNYHIEKSSYLAYNIFLIGSPIILISSLFYSLLVGLTIIQGFFYLITMYLVFLMEIALVLYDSILATDKKLIATSIYSIANSISVPLVFYIFQTFTSILIAWILSFLITMIYTNNILLKIFKNIKIELKEAIGIIRFGFPMYLTTIYAIIVQRIDIFILYTNFESGETSLYYWSVRIAFLSFELFSAVLTGLFPLLTKIITRGNTEDFRIILNKMIRLTVFLSIVFYNPLIYSGKFIIGIILSTEFLEGVILLKIALLAMMLESSRLVINTSYNAEGKRRILTFVSIFAYSSRIISIVILVKYGPLGLILSLLLQNTATLMVLLYFRRKEFNLYHSYFRLIIFSIIISILSWFLPSGDTILQFLTYFIFYFILILIITILIRPINNEDVLLLTKILNENVTRHLFRVSKYIAH